MKLNPFGRRPSAAFVISLVALFVALGGVGYAATQLPPNSVGTRELRDDSATQRVTSTLTAINGIYIDDAHNYLEFADPMVTVTGNGTPQRVTVTCLLQSGQGTESRSVTLDTGSSTAPLSVAMALMNAANHGDTRLSCVSSASATPAATVDVTSSLYAIQTGN